MAANRSKEHSLKGCVKDELKRFGTTTTAHGLPRILASKYLVTKIIWLLFTLTSIGLCAYMIIRGILIYIEFGTTSLIRQYPSESITFPVVSICNRNRMLTRAATDHIREYYQSEFNVNITDMDDFFEQAYIKETIYPDIEWIFYQTFLPGFNVSLKRSFGYSLEEMLVRCEFDSKPCNHSWFDWYYHPAYGNCFKFNSGEINGIPNSIDLLRVDKPKVGLYMELFTSLPDDYYNYYLYEFDYNALIVKISDQKNFPLRGEGDKIKPGVMATFSLSLTHYTNLPSPYSECQYQESVETEMGRQMRRANIPYNRLNCISICQQQLKYKNSGCFKPTLPNIFNLPICSNITQYYQNKDSQFSTLLCKDSCPAECELNVFDETLSFADFPTTNYAYKLLSDKRDYFERMFQTDNVSYDMLRKSLSGVFIYFDETIVTEIEQSPSIVLVDLIANIGGTLGLFVGLSVLSIVEVIELVVNLILIAIRFRKEKSNQ